MVTDAGTAIFWLLLVRLTVVAEGTAYPVRTTLVVVRPYHYPPTQKNKLEQQCAEMLQHVGISVAGPPRQA